MPSPINGPVPKANGGRGRAALALSASLLVVGSPSEWTTALALSPSAVPAPVQRANSATSNPVLLQPSAEGDDIGLFQRQMRILSLAQRPINGRYGRATAAADTAQNETAQNETAAPQPPATVDRGRNLGWWLLGSLALLASIGGWLLLGRGKQRSPRSQVPAEAENEILSPSLPSADRATPTASAPSDALVAADLPLEATTRLTPVDIVDSLVNELASADGATRRHAIWELGQRGNSDAIQPLVNGLLQSDSQEKSLILAALAEISSRSLKPMHRALALGLQDPSPEVRKNAIRDLSRVYDTVVQLSHMLAHASQDPDPGVQETAQWALSQLNRIPAATYPNQPASLDATADSEGHRLPPS
jgi:hypothetical protein